eukprot:4275785-Pleurochrysis_carterae.AAC.3
MVLTDKDVSLRAMHCVKAEPNRDGFKDCKARHMLALHACPLTRVQVLRMCCMFCNCMPCARMCEWRICSCRNALERIA